MKAVFLDFATLGPGDVDLGELRALLPDLEFFAHTPPNEIASRLEGVEIAIVNKVRLGSAELAQAAKLKLICLAATGTDNVDLAAAERHRIVVSNIRNYCTPSVVQHVFSMILALKQNLGSYAALTSSGAWAQSEQFCLHDFPFGELHGKTLGVVGYGTLGQAVAKVAGAFGMRVLAAQLPYTQSGSPNTAPGAERAPLATVLQQSDVLSLHCPLTADTRQLINADSLAQMPRHAILINTARGGLVDGAALVAALRDGRLAGAGVDVLPQEPPPADEPLLQKGVPNLLVTPHIAWAARESRQRAIDEIVKNVAAFQADAPRHMVSAV